MFRRICLKLHTFLLLLRTSQGWGWTLQKTFHQPYAKTKLSTLTFNSLKWSTQHLGRFGFSLCNSYLTGSCHNQDNTTTRAKKEHSVEEALKLLRRAQELRAEAQVMESKLKESRASKLANLEAESQALYEHLFAQNEPVTLDTVTKVIRQWTVRQAGLVLDLLYIKWQQQRQSTSTIIESRTLPYNETEVNNTLWCAETLIAAAQLLDKEVFASGNMTTSKLWSDHGAFNLKLRWSELVRADELSHRIKLISNLNSTFSKTNVSIEQHLESTSAIKILPANNSQGLRQPPHLPKWVPTSFLPLIGRSKTQISKEDIILLKERVLKNSGFFCTSTVSTSSASLFRGNIKNVGTLISVKNNSAVVFGELQRRMRKEGLIDRIQLFFLLDPEWRPNRRDRKNQAQPALLAVSSLIDPNVSKVPQSVAKTTLKRCSVIFTLVTTFTYAINCFSLNPTFFNLVINECDARVLAKCMPIFWGILLLQIIHEVSRAMVARWHTIRIGPPLPIPSKLGTFGCITKIRSFPQNRAALMDVALSGPLTSWFLSVCLMTVGIIQTRRATSAALETFPFVPVIMLKGSLLSGTLLSFLAPKIMLLPNSQPIPASPLILIGFSGMYAAALNLLPIFRLDGGKACNAALGLPSGSFVSTVTLLLLCLIAALTNSELVDLALTWCLFVVVFQRGTEVPVQDDVTKIDCVRFSVWIASLVASLLSLAPFPGGSRAIL